ncbi:MAG: hypothetical protein ACE5IW_04135 [bacterium]
MQNTKLFIVSLLSLYLAATILQCSSSADSNISTAAKEKSLSDTLALKISSPIAAILTKMEAKGMTANNVQKFDPETLSSSLIKVDRDGNIQTYIYLAEIGDEIIQQLKMKQVKIELISKKWNIVQGWIPFYMIKEISQLNFVKSIKPPDYGKTISKKRRER